MVSMKRGCTVVGGALEEFRCGPSFSLGVGGGGILLKEMKFELKPEAKDEGRSGGVAEEQCCPPRRNIPARAGRFHCAHYITKALKDAQCDGQG